MLNLQKLFPLSFKVKDVADLVIRVIVYLVVGAIVGVIIGFLSAIPVIGLIFTLIGSLAEIYVFAGVVIVFLTYFKIIK